MNMIKTFFLTLTLLMHTLAFGRVFETVIVNGVIKSFDETHVVMQDGFGQVHKVAKKELPKEFKLMEGEQISFLKKVNFNKISRMNLKMQNINTMPETYLKELLQELHKFSISNEKFYNLNFSSKIKPEGTKTSSVNSFEQFLDLVMASAYAEGGLNCLYAGWPSTLNHNTCRGPWTSQARAASATYHSCGRDNAFRCNPALFGDGFTADGVVDGADAATPHEPYAGSSVRVFNRAPISEGICVESTSTSSLTQKCLEASRDRLPQVIARMQADPAIYENLMTIINDYCNAQSSYASRNGCSDLNQRLSEIRFAVTTQKPVCQVVASAENETCASPAKSILVKCHKGGQVYQGHLRAQDITSDIAGLAVGASLSGSTIPDLYRGSCGEGTKINDFNQCTSIVQSQGSPSSNARVSLGTGGADASGTCQGETCIVNSNCIGTPVTGGAEGAGDIYTVTMVCACNQLPSGEAATDASIIQACGVEHSLPVLSSGQTTINSVDEFKATASPL